jgi:hypothetical protein
LPNRILRDGINSSPRINTLSPGAEILYRRLMSVADDYGRFYSAAATVRGACWPTAPGNVTESEISRWLVELQSGDRPLLRIYTVNNCEFLEMADFGQRVQSKSKFPEPLPCTTVDPPLIHGDPPGNIGASRSRRRITHLTVIYGSTSSGRHIPGRSAKKAPGNTGIRSAMGNAQHCSMKSKSESSRQSRSKSLLVDTGEELTENSESLTRLLG